MTNEQKRAIETSVEQYATQQRAAGNVTPIATLLLMTHAEQRATLLPFFQALRDAVAETQTNLPARRTAEDASLAAVVSSLDDLIATF